MNEKLLAVFAHPDDETFRPGGTLALLAKKGVSVQVMTVTRGQAGSCGDPPVCMPEELPAVRERELNCACAALGILPPRILDYVDGSLAHSDPQQLLADILAVIKEFQPQVILSFGLDGLSGHLDHIGVGCAARAAFLQCQTVSALYTLALPLYLAQEMKLSNMRPVPDEKITLTVDVLSVWEMKKAAIGCHVSQLSSTPLLGEAEERQKVFFGTEFFIRTAQRDQYGDFFTRYLRAKLPGRNAYIE
ncbi:MAG: PIG-L family deacetylase [Chloroflexi bacterium]|nr:MAG: PIG-L family deacetylase [Chloroflexota bacterium]